MDLGKTLHLSAAGMRAQGTRLRVIAENVANAGSVAAAVDETLAFIFQMQWIAGQ